MQAIKRAACRAGTLTSGKVKTTDGKMSLNDYNTKKEGMSNEI